MYRQADNNIYRAVVVVWLTLSISSCVFAAVTWLQLSRRLAESRDAAAVHREVDSLERLLLDTEAGQRGFALTGDETFLQPLTTGSTNLTRQFDRLVALAKDDSALLSQVMELRAQAELKLRFNDRVIELRRTQGIDAAATLVGTGEGKKIMEQIRRRAQFIRDMRAQSLDESTAEEQSQMTRALLTDLGTGVLGVGAGVFAFFLARVAMQHQAREKQLIEDKLQAERSSREKTVFLANMSHEIRTPMNAILGFSELLEGDLVDPRHRQYVSSIRASAGSLLQLINDILDMSKIEAGVMELRPEPTDPREICALLKTVFAEPAAKKGVKLECLVAEDLPNAVLIDRIRLRQVLLNLVGNAVKFTDHGHIHVRVQWERQESGSQITLVIEVRDTGVGIPQDKLEAIFKPFVQAGAHREKEKAGTGLGLAIVRRLTEMMGGTVTASSAMGQGSTFRLCFPNVAVSVRLATVESGDPLVPVDFNELRPSTLLVVDDTETNCQLVAGMFTGTHHCLHFGANGREAIEKARDLKPDAVLLDIRMPGMDGREALAEIRKLPGLELTPVIAVTASSLLSEESELKSKFSGYVRKPFSRRDLFHELAQFLPRQSKPAPAPASATPGAITAATTAGTNAESPPAIAVPPALADRLQRLLEQDWPALRDSLAVNESKAFSARLQALAATWPCPPLEHYAQSLARHADNYAVVELEQQLLEFPSLVERLQPATPA